MKKVMIELYTAKELQEQFPHGFDEAFHEFCIHVDYSWDGENRAVLKEFEQRFPVDIKDWSYGSGGGREYINFEMYADDEVSELTGQRLATYLYNNHFHDLYEGKYYSTWGEKGSNPNSGNEQRKLFTRHSKVIFEERTLTGFCVGYDILVPIFKFLKKPDDTVTFEELMEDCLNEWLRACTSDYEYHYSGENFIDMSEANDWYYLPDGTMQTVPDEKSS